MIEDCYAVLGVAHGACRDEIQKAYRELALKYHPDVNAGDPDAEKKFVRIEDAYETLCEPERRRIIGAFHTPLSAFLTVRCRANAIRRDGVMGSDNHTAAQIGVVTLLWLILLVVLVLVTSNAVPLAEQDNAAALVGSAAIEPLQALREMVTILFVGITVLYVAFLVVVLLRRTES